VSSVTEEVTQLLIREQQRRDRGRWARWGRRLRGEHELVRRKRAPSSSASSRAAEASALALASVLEIVILVPRHDAGMAAAARLASRPRRRRPQPGSRTR
jgi:hypothetical protein